MTLPLQSSIRPRASGLDRSRLAQPSGGQRSEGRRDALQDQCRRHDQTARTAAERGDMAEAARAILGLLDCERRLDSAGPQVLQVIKPRA